MIWSPCPAQVRSPSHLHRSRNQLQKTIYIYIEEDRKRWQPSVKLCYGIGLNALTGVLKNVRIEERAASCVHRLHLPPGRIHLYSMCSQSIRDNLWGLFEAPDHNLHLYFHVIKLCPILTFIVGVNGVKFETQRLTTLLIWCLVCFTRGPAYLYVA